MTQFSTKIAKIPRVSIQRLSIYLETLERMLASGSDVISSYKLAKACNVNASQVRKDLAYFGEFGVRGVGYNIESLISSVRESLFIDKPWSCALVGIGNIGRAILHHKGFQYRRYNIVAAFDDDPLKVGLELAGLEILPIKKSAEALADKDVQIAIITTPAEYAQSVSDVMIDCGVRGILNYTSMNIFVPDGVFIENVDFFNHLYALSLRISMFPPMKGSR